MLVLTRRYGQSIMIDRDIEVVILHHNSDQVRLGLIASEDIKIHRKEVYERIHDYQTIALKLKNRSFHKRGNNDPYLRILRLADRLSVQQLHQDQGHFFVFADKSRLAFDDETFQIKVLRKNNKGSCVNE